MSLLLFLILMPPALPDVRLDDLRQFPPAAVATANEELAGRHVCWLKARQGAWPTTNRTALEEALHAQAVWHTLESAVLNEVDDPAWSLCRLAELRDYLGSEAYFLGRMPPPVPPSHFRYLDRLPFAPLPPAPLN